MRTSEATTLFDYLYWAGDYPNLESVVEHCKRDESDMRTWLASLTDADFDAPPARDEDRQPLWHYVLHLVSHGIPQFSDVAVLLTWAGHSRGDIGFLEFVGRRPRPG
jgi:hypothetical protein